MGPSPLASSSSSQIPVSPLVATTAGSTSEKMIAPVKEEKPFTLWPGLYHSPVTAALWHARSSFVERTSHLPLDGPAQTNLLHKTPEQNRTNVQYHFATDSLLREQYRNPWNSIRIGKLLEDLDALAGTIAMKVRLQCLAIFKQGTKLTSNLLWTR